MSSEARTIVEHAESEDAARLLTDVYEHELPSVLEGLVDEYLELPDARPRFMWQWVHKLAPQNTLPCVDAAYVDAVPVDKTITIMFITLLDDVLEKRGDRATFEEAAKIPFAHQTADLDRDGVDAEYVSFTRRVWDTLTDRLERAPEFETYDRLFRFDVRQAINAIQYTELAIRRSDLATMGDLERYESHNMVMFAYADIDLMHSDPRFGDDLSTLREAIWHAQQMARIGNWLSTWERELREGDFSSGVLVYALEEGIVRQEEVSALEGGDAEAHDRVVERIERNGVEEEFLSRWDDHYAALHEINGDVSSMDLTPFIDGLKEVLRYHLASTGLK